MKLDYRLIVRDLIIVCLITALAFALTRDIEPEVITIYEEVEVVTEVVTEVVKEVEPTYYYIWAKVTMYAPFDNQSGICADENPNVTSTGRTPSRKCAAVDPRKIPYGTRMYVEGYGEIEAQDTGGALRSYNGFHIDLFAETYEEAMAHGVQYKMVRVYKED